MYYECSSRSKEDKGEENIIKIIAENFPGLGREMDIHVSGPQIPPSRFNPNCFSLGYIIVKFSKGKDKENILKAGRERHQVTYKAILSGWTTNISSEILQARRQWDVIFKVLKENNKKTINQEYHTQQSNSSEMKVK